MSAESHTSVDPRMFLEKCLLSSHCLQTCLLESQLSLHFHWSLFKLNFFLARPPFLGLGLKSRLSLQRTGRWSVGHSALGITLVWMTSLISRLCTRLLSIRCQCLDRGCIQVVLRLSFCWKMVLMMTSCCSEQCSCSKRPLSLQLPTPCLPSTPFQESASWPTLALKSPRTITLSSSGVLWRQLWSSE